MVRFAVGWNLAVHGWGKVLRGPAGQAALLVKDGYPFGESYSTPSSAYKALRGFQGSLCAGAASAGARLSVSLSECANR
jgi:hypothetical protein